MVLVRGGADTAAGGGVGRACVGVCAVGCRGAVPSSVVPGRSGGGGDRAGQERSRRSAPSGADRGGDRAGGAGLVPVQRGGLRLGAGAGHAVAGRHCDGGRGAAGGFGAVPSPWPAEGGTSAASVRGERGRTAAARDRLVRPRAAADRFRRHDGGAARRGRPVRRIRPAHRRPAPVGTHRHRRSPAATGASGRRRSARITPASRS